MASASSSKKAKKADSTGHPELTARDFDADTQKALDEIDTCQNQIEALNEQSSEEIVKIEQRYNDLRKPHFNTRAANIAKIQNFWFTAFNNHPDLSTLLDDTEEDCVSYLSKLEVEEFEDIKTGYRLKFYFDENPYFENEVLTKEFQLELLGEPVSTSVPIRWKPNMNFTKPTQPATPTRAGRKRQIEHRSFFGWYLDHSDPTSDSIAEVFKDDLWHNPLQYFLIPDVDVQNGVNAEDMDEEAEEEDDDEDEEDDDDEGEAEASASATAPNKEQEMPVPEEEEEQSAE